MKAVEFQSTVAPGGGLEVPAEIAREIPAGERLRVVVMWDVPDSDDDWRAAGRRAFEAAYSPDDSVYEKLIDAPLPKREILRGLGTLTERDRKSLLAAVRDAFPR